MDRHTQLLTLGVLFLVLAASETLIGTAISTQLRKGFVLRRRADNPPGFWWAVILTALIGATGMAMGLGLFS